MPGEKSESIEEKWQKFVNSDTLIGSDLAMVKDVKEVEFYDDLIKLIVKDPFIYENLEIGLKKLQSSFREITGSNQEIELVKVKKELELKQEREKHPIEEKIILEFNAFEEKSES